MTRSEQALTLRNDGLSYKQIGERMGTTAHTVGALISKARGRMFSVSVTPEIAEAIAEVADDLDCTRNHAINILLAMGVRAWRS
jgi:DNA-binding CsgD family transcriptional regulator